MIISVIIWQIQPNLLYYVSVIKELPFDFHRADINHLLGDTQELILIAVTRKHSRYAAWI
jgi:hypothetical protein